MSVFAASSHLTPPPKIEINDVQTLPDSSPITIKARYGFGRCVTLHSTLDQIAASTGYEHIFKLKTTTSLRKLFYVYAETIGKEVDELKFIYEGQRLNPHNTPNTYEMENGDTIDVMLEYLLLAHNGTLALAPPASRTAAPVPSFAATQPYQIRGRRPRNPSTIFRDIFFATYKVLLPSNEAEVSRLASDAWHELSEEERLFYKTIAKLEKEAYELGKSTHALQRRGSTGDKGSKNDGGRRMIPSLSVANLPYGSVAQGMDAQSFFYRTPTAAPEIPRIQYPPFFMTNTDTITHDVHATQGQGMTDVQHGRATQSMQTSQQWPPVPAAFAESSDSSDP
ncbi:uncharacterized protein EV420DRAFT_1770235 [Desarmillaria tabescens]|uniref:HMG box domain-containing protein n=1 Tax=Armillaria tabescens TaxID=1929756 RepID=A0AA39J667_ARMTA|nr:uncharacterized protein EV420DRAFT_1770235 [Desarmillaria tabescens]KAK0436851.1 hypothetical protein EV420DRAFT_1770235 [Desarmillaria tabescens]